MPVKGKLKVALGIFKEEMFLFEFCHRLCHPVAQGPEARSAHCHWLFTEAFLAEGPTGQGEL